MHRFVCCLAAALLAAASAYAQAAASISGMVTDPAGASVPAAHITITNAATALSRHNVRSTPELVRYAVEHGWVSS
jgi:Spy/CpxP family protein refolding chaperone